MIQIVTHSILHMPESISTKVFTAVPARDYNDVISQPFPIQHPRDYHAGPGLTVVILDGS